MKLKTYQIWILPIISSLLLSCGWMQGAFQLLLFLGFIPILIVEEHYYQQSDRYRSFRIFPKAFLAFFLWNCISAWWIWNASAAGVLMVVVFNSTFMATTFWLFHATKRILGRRLGYIAFIAYWIGFEYLHINWELAWPWFTLGNGLSENISIIQWYEYTGVLGGSLWILLINVLFAESIIKYITNAKNRLTVKSLLSLAIIITLPLTISIIIYKNYKEKGNPVNVVVVQPNIDPYTDKFGGMAVKEQLDEFISLAESLTDEKTDYIVGPETAISESIWEEDFSTHPSILLLKKLNYKFPKAKLVIGASTVRMFKPGEKISVSAREFSKEEGFYDSYNTALQIDTTNIIQSYHKSQLVLGVEKMPFAGTFGFIKDLSIELGGTSGSLGSQEEPNVFNSANNIAKVAPVICYESIFGEYITEYIKKGSDIIFVITNDGWWGNTPGYRQHLSYSSLRAIETRRDIARSANTGISCFINQLGEIRQQTKWWTPTAIKDTLYTNNTITFYVKTGDYIGKIAALISIILFVFYLSSSIKKKFKRQEHGK